MDDLTILSVVENDSGLIDLMIASVLKYTSSVPQFLICENGYGSSELDKYRDKPNFKIIKHSPKFKGGSNRHGEGINRLLPEIATKYASIIESDCVVVSSKWCDISDAKVLASKKGEFNNMPFYYAAFIVFETEELRNMDFRPGSDSTRVDNKSYKAHEDVAWRLNKHIPNNKIKLMECVDCKTGNGQILDNTFQSEEYVIDGKTVVVHFGRGSNLGGKAKRKGFDDHKTQLVKFRHILEQIVKEPK